jgi:hypothetical protein
MKQSIRQHLNETKDMIQQLANTILFNQSDLEDDTRMFAAVH